MSADGTPTTGFRDRARGDTALLVIDMIGAMDFPGVDRMERELLDAGARIAGLCDAARAANVPVIYVNDNFGEWHSQSSLLVDRAREAGGPGRHLAELLAPSERDFFIIKPQFSGFYATNLPVLLPKLGVSRLILTGIAADICVLFTAADAHMRDYALWVPEDGVIAHTRGRKACAIEIMRQGMAAETRATDVYSLRQWLDVERDKGRQTSDAL